MPKRKHDDEDKVTKKIRRLEKKLKKCKRRRGRIISSSSEDSTQSHHNQNGMYLHFILLSDSEIISDKRDPYLKLTHKDACGAIRA